VRPRDFAPDDADFGASDGGFGAVDISYSFAEVEEGVVSGIYTFNLDERGVWVGIALPSLV